MHASLLTSPDGLLCSSPLNPLALLLSDPGQQPLSKSPPPPLGEKVPIPNLDKFRKELLEVLKPPESTEDADVLFPNIVS